MNKNIKICKVKLSKYRKEKIYYFKDIDYYLRLEDVDLHGMEYHSSKYFVENKSKRIRVRQVKKYLKIFIRKAKNGNGLKIYKNINNHIYKSKSFEFSYFTPQKENLNEKEKKARKRAIKESKK